MKRRPWSEELEWIISVLHYDDERFALAIKERNPAVAALAVNYRKIARQDPNDLKPLLDEYAKSRREEAAREQREHRADPSQERCVQVAQTFLERLARALSPGRDSPGSPLLGLEPEPDDGVIAGFDGHGLPAIEEALQDRAQGDQPQRPLPAGTP
jgi:hypothetical protein